MHAPEQILNYINGAMVPAVSGATFTKRSPHSGRALCQVARSAAGDADVAIRAALSARKGWAETTVVARGNLMRDLALRMRERRQEIAEITAAETGKAVAHALGEADAAIEMGFFVAGEGRRYYGRTTTATMAHRTVLTQRQPLGIASLIIASNTPMPNVAWKAFPSMLCGNTSILKPSEDTPATAWLFADICREVGIPPGVLNVVQGLGAEIGPPLVEDPRIALVSFTGSCKTGRWIQRVAGERLAKVCLELGGKNALVVCDDADLVNAVKWTLAAAFSNAGQRCAAASRIVVFDAVYDRFREQLVAATQALKVGPDDDSYLGPVINEQQLKRMVAAVQAAAAGGARTLVGGQQLTDAAHAAGCYMAPTILENVCQEAEISRVELFGPITILYRVQGFDEALAVVNNSPYGLTAAIHTASLHRAMRFAEQVHAGVVVVNGGTHGSEPHMGFGGVKDSGTGWREAGVEALDVYSDWKYVNLIIDPGKV